MVRPSCIARRPNMIAHRTNTLLADWRVPSLQVFAVGFCIGNMMVVFRVFLVRDVLGHGIVHDGLVSLAGVTERRRGSRGGRHDERRRALAGVLYLGRVCGSGCLCRRVCDVTVLCRVSKGWAAYIYMLGSFHLVQIIHCLAMRAAPCSRNAPVLIRGIAVAVEAAQAALEQARHALLHQNLNLCTVCTNVICSYPGILHVARLR
jgi:hypothetical protein